VRCPDCARETVYVPVPERPGTSGKVVERKPGVLLAVVRDGTCATCHRNRKHGRVPGDRRYTGHGRFLKGVMSDAECEAIRNRLRVMELDRRARGIPAEGIPTEDWAIGNGGLYSYEVK
jgi:hypothetical protein